MRAPEQDCAESRGVVRVLADNGGRDNVDLVPEILGQIDALQLALGEVVENVEASEESERGGRVELVLARQEVAQVLSRLLPPAVRHQAPQASHVQEDARLVLQPGPKLRSIDQYQLG